MKKIITFLMTAFLLFNINVFAEDNFTDYNDSDVLTRGESVQMIYEHAGSPAASKDAPFSDKNTQYKCAIDWAYDNNIFLGFEDGTCRPEQPITREQFASLLSRWCKTPTVSASLLQYEDRYDISAWAEDAVHWCISYDIINLAGNKISPSEKITIADARLMMKRIKNLPNLTQLENDIKALTENPRPIGSDSEKNVTDYIAERFKNMGYDVTKQPYGENDATLGHNVIATKGTDVSSDILVISAHHDSVNTSFGANDNASGVAGLLYIAETLKSIETDTELRFISFTDEESGKNGSRQYVESLSEEEKERIIGCIQLDMLGGLGTNDFLVCTTDGTANWLTDLLLDKNNLLNIGREDASDHAIFQLAGIPSVLITQNGRGYLYHTAGDTSRNLNLMTIYESADMVKNAVMHIADKTTPSYREIALTSKNERLYSQTRQSKILFSDSLKANEAYIGVSGELIKQWDETGDGWRDIHEAYLYKMRWFGGKKPMTTHYNYRNGYLENIQIYPDKNDYTVAKLQTLISETHGKPCSENEDENKWDWQDELYGKYIILTETNGNIEISVYPYSVGLSNTLASYECAAGETEIDDLQHKKVWDLLCTILPPDHREKIGGFDLFTDGFSNILAYSATMGTSEQPDNSRFTIAVDYYDVYDENGNARDWSKLIYTLVHEYGHVLLENDTQIDTSVEKDIHKPEGFIEGSFRKRYYDEFWRDPYSSFLGSYSKNPNNYVSEYAGSMFHEDIADTFAVFVFTDKPSGNSIAEKKILFFWQDDNMISLRKDIRKGLGLNRNM